MTLYCYPQPGKAKAKRICTAFAQGCGGKVIDDGQLRDGDAMFYGVAPGMESLWRAAHEGGRDVYFADNAYFDETRERYFRITKNRLQHAGFGTSDGKRFAALGVELKPWRTDGDYLLLCPQSEHFMRCIAGYYSNWTYDTIAMLRGITDRPIKVRPWSRDKGAQAAGLKLELQHAHALITWSSAAAVTAVVNGVPAAVNTGAASVVAITLRQLEDPPKPARESWANVLADNQFDLEEMRNGYAWAWLTR